MTTPNFTIITPGGCNAKCGFCTDSMNRSPSKNYMANLIKTIATLPPEYTQVSISGGEPTLSPDLMTILWLIKASNRFSKVVLTTNGSKLASFVDQLSGLVNHVNISRHAFDYDANVKIFGTSSIPTDAQVKVMASDLNRLGIDVNLNHVYNDELQVTVGNGVNYITKYVNYAKSLNASSVAFRYDQNHNSLKETHLERYMLDQGYKIINEGGCPSCRTHTHLVDGMSVMMKASLAEPKLVMGKEIYELIYHIDGRLCTDWDGNTEYDPISNTLIERATTLSGTTLKDALSSQIIPVVSSTKQVLDAVKRPAKLQYLSSGCGSSGGCGR